MSRCCALQQFGCDSGQGFHLAVPLEAHALEALLLEERAERSVHVGAS